MKTVQIEFDSNGVPTVSPNSVVCESNETLGFLICSKTRIIEAVNLACKIPGSNIFSSASAPQGARQHHCKVDLHDTGDSEMPTSAVIWALALENRTEQPITIAYAVTPFVGGNVYKPGELDPFIIITKRP